MSVDVHVGTTWRWGSTALTVLWWSAHIGSWRLPLRQAPLGTRLYSRPRLSRSVRQPMFADVAVGEVRSLGSGSALGS